MILLILLILESDIVNQNLSLRCHFARSIVMHFISDIPSYFPALMAFPALAGAGAREQQPDGLVDAAQRDLLLRVVNGALRVLTKYIVAIYGP